MENGRVGTKRDRSGRVSVVSVTSRSVSVTHRVPPTPHVCPLLSIHPQANGGVQPVNSQKLKDILHNLHSSVIDTLHLFFYTFRLGRGQTEEATTIWFPFRRQAPPGTEEWRRWYDSQQIHPNQTGSQEEDIDAKVSSPIATHLLPR